MDLIAFSHLTGFHTWTGHIHVGCITRALHPCDMLWHLQEVPGQLRAAHVQHTGDFYAVHAGSRRFP